MSRYYLGVDGGQSSTIALIADERGEIVGAGRGGACNHVSQAEARAKFLRVLGGCIQDAARHIDLAASGPHFAAACLGFSGGAEDKLDLARELVHTDLLKVTHDAEIALTGALAGEPGIIVIAGTGSMAFGRNAKGETARAGGWGHIFGDEGGAFDLVRRALCAALRFEEGWGLFTSLHATLLEETGANSADQLLHRFYRDERSQIAKLAPLVTRAAENGDTVAQQILSQAAFALTGYVSGVQQKLFAGISQVLVAPVGGVFCSVALHRYFVEHLRATTDCEPATPRSSPAVGALLEALRLDGNQARVTGAPEAKA